MCTDNYIFCLFFTIIGIAYILIILTYTFGWFSLKKFKTKKNTFSTKISVIIPARNEEEKIVNSLNDLINQDYPKGLFEIIVIDDSSTDNTFSLVYNFKKTNKSHRIKLIKLKEKKVVLPYKKKAISMAIQKSECELIISTDADCRIGPKWISTIAEYYETYKPKIIVGPVSFFNEESLFEKFQSLEFLSLIASTAGAIKLGKPIMCNGANLAYQKDAFYKVGGFGTKDMFASGDDVFLLLKLKKHFGSRAVRFLKNNDAVVFTEAKKSFKELYSQRVRWSSKSKGYKDITILSVAIIVYFLNLSLLVCLIGSLIFPDLLIPAIILFFIKLINRKFGERICGEER